MKEGVAQGWEKEKAACSREGNNTQTDACHESTNSRHAKAGVATDASVTWS